MSEQTPPPHDPTPSPSEGASDGAGHGVGHGTTPPPPPPAEGAAGATGQSAPPKKKKGLLLGLIAALVVLALLVAGGIFAFSKLSGEDEHTIAITKTAGDMKRDTAKEKTLKTQLDSAEKQFKSQAKSVGYVRSGVYDQDDTKRGPEGALVFLGAKLTKPQSPTKFVTSFSKQATSNGFKTSNIAPGENGGKAVCAYATSGQKVAICAWATTDTIGELVPTVPGYDSAKLSKIMIDLRSDVETTD